MAADYDQKAVFMEKWKGREMERVYVPPYESQLP
jgi:hypothetical protein